MPRHLSRTPEIDARLVEGLRTGNTRRASCAYAGISDDTLRRWLKDENQPDFAELIEEAESFAERAMAGVLEKAALGYDVREEKTTSRSEVKMKVTTNSDGTTIEEPVVVTLTDTESFYTRRFDWKAAESWLKRRRRQEWGDNVSVDVDKEISELIDRLAGLEPAGQTQVSG
jgi:hypothetical protein